MKAGLLLLLLALPQDDRLRGLIERLSDANIAVRERAAQDLVRMGTDAVPPLETLLSSSDIDLRARAAQIIHSIQESQVLRLHWRRGPRITLEVQSSPIATVLASLSKQGGDTFKFNPADFQDPVTLEVKEASFWDALDSLCRAAPALTWEVDGNALAFTKKRRPPCPEKREGEFAIRLESIRLTQEKDFAGRSGAWFLLDLASTWESGVVPIGVEQSVWEVVDEQGKNLAAPNRSFMYGVWAAAPVSRTKKDSFYVALPQGLQGLKKLSKVSGTAIYRFPRSYQDVTLDLRSASETVTFDRYSLTIRTVRALKDRCAIDLYLLMNVLPDEPAFDRLPHGEMAFVDDRGALHRSVTASITSNISNSVASIYAHLEAPLPEGTTPVALKLRLVKDLEEKRVAFEFRDLSLE